MSGKYISGCVFCEEFGFSECVRYILSEVPISFPFTLLARYTDSRGQGSNKEGNNALDSTCFKSKFHAPSHAFKVMNKNWLDLSILDNLRAKQRFSSLPE